MFPPHSYGGYELWCRDVVRRWRRAGHEILVLTSDVQVPGAAGVAEPGIEVRRVLKLYWKDHAILDPPLWQRQRWERANQAELKTALRRHAPHVASAWAMGAMSLGLLTSLGERGVPVVSVICDEWPIYGPQVDGWSRFVAAHPRLAAAAGRVSGLPVRLPSLGALGPACFVSERMRAKARELSPWTFPDAEVVPSGVEFSEFPRAPDAGSRPWGWRLLHVGRLDPRKGVHKVVEAFAACPPEATLDLLGDGDSDYLGELGRLAQQLGVHTRVRFARSERGAVASWYARADAVIFAPVWEEPFGLVPLEAMACGTPVVASPTGGSTEFLVDGVNCVAFTSGDAGGLTAALERLAGDSALRRHIVVNGFDTAARFDAERLARELESWHLRAAAGSALQRQAEGLCGSLAPERRDQEGDHEAADPPR